jgi:hypothetical protein
MSDYFFGSLLFSIGSLLLTIDAFKQQNRNYYLIFGTVLFDIGCVFFMKDSLTQYFV